MNLPFEGDTNDDSGLGNDGTNYGAVFVGGKYGQGLSFDGNDWVDCGTDSSLNISGNRTVEAWLYVDSFSVTRGVFVFKNNNFGVYVLNPSGVVMIWARPGSDNNTGYILSTSTWYHLALTYDGTNIKLFVNGLLEYTTARTINPTGNAFWIGSDTNGAGNYFDGMIDEVRFYNRSLSYSEIKAHALGDY